MVAVTTIDSSSDPGVHPGQVASPSEAWQSVRATGQSCLHTFTSRASFEQPMNPTCMFQSGKRVWRKPTHALQEHTNFLQKGLDKPRTLLLHLAELI